MILVVTWSMLVGACTGTTDDSAAPTATSSTAPSTTTTTFDVTTSAVTEPPSLTTTLATTTTAPPVTTTTIAVWPVTEHPNLPSAQGRHLVDWNLVGPRWTLALYDAQSVTTMTAGPTILYLVDPDGTRYEVASWPMGGPYAIAGWAGTGDTALVLRADNQAAIVDLRTGIETGTVPLPTDYYASPITFTLPTGRNLVVLTDDGTTQRVERHTRSGTVLAVLGEQTTPSDVRRSLEWLYGYDGTFALVKHSGGIELVENDGTFVRGLWTPMGRTCAPVRWWTADSFLASCLGDGSAFGHDFYSQLWILETDGTAGDMLTAFPPGSVPFVDFGFIDAWRLPSQTILQWSGDCGAANVQELAADGSASPLGGTSSHRFVEADASGMTILAWQACDGSEGRLYRADLSGHEVLELVPRVGDAWGVADAASLAVVFP
ncbi:MAG: hypothetical protein M3094_06375 [Actinomycetia bacterium]|nr:hypothetical protein [Actinomycetes bacterium]